MTTEQAIKKAIEGGWNNKQTANSIPITKSNFEAQMVLLGNLYVAWFLDPSFWRSLGNALGWNEHEIIIHHKARMVTVVTRPGGSRTFKVPAHDVRRKIKNARWKKEWHRFIDHLAEGKTVEIFFESLT